jgi:hypothetical protein
MPKKWLSTISFLSLIAIQSQVCGDCTSKPDTKKSSKSDTKHKKEHIPDGWYHTDDRSMFVQADYLFWKPYQEDLSYGAVENFANPAKVEIRRKELNLDWNSGVRLGFGLYTCDRWDISLTGTYFYSQGRKEITMVSPSRTIINYFDPEATGSNATSASSRIQLVYWTVDLLFGREFFPSHRFDLHPFIAVRGIGANESFKVNYTPTTLDATTVGPATRMKAKNDFWGIGPRFGLDAAFHMSKCFFLMGGVSGSIVLGQFRVKERFTGLSPTPTTQAINTFTVRDNHNAIRTNFEANFGVGFESWNDANDMRFELALMAEAVNWFGMNQLSSNVITPGATTNVTATDGGAKRHGDLSFLGLTVHFQLDF